jgi:hypothetical protein
VTGSEAATMDPNASSITVAGTVNLSSAGASRQCSNYFIHNSSSTAIHHSRGCPIVSVSLDFVHHRHKLTCVTRVKTDDNPLFLGDGSLAAAPAPKLNQRGLRSVIKVVDDRCLYVLSG